MLSKGVKVTETTSSSSFSICLIIIIIVIIIQFSFFKNYFAIVSSSVLFRI